MLDAVRYDTDADFAIGNMGRVSESTGAHNSARLSKSVSKNEAGHHWWTSYVIPHGAETGGKLMLQSSIGPLLTIIAASMNTTAYSYPQAVTNQIEAIRAPLEDRNAQLSAEILSYRSLTSGWDGPGSRVPSQEAIRDAIAFIDLIPIGIEHPEPMVSADGDVGFYWKTQDSYIDILFKGNNEIAYYARAKDEKPARGVKPYARSALPKDLLNVLLKI